MRPTLLAALLGTFAVLGGCGADHATQSEGSASCAARVELDGYSYNGYGGLTRDPALSGRVVRALMPGCDDGNGASPDEVVKAAELSDLPLSRAVFVDGHLYVRGNDPLPEETRAWFQPQRCETAGAFELHGDWLAVQGPKKVRFDGDLRPPYRLNLHVTEAPQPYVGTTIQVHATSDTDPALGPRDVRTSLWKGGTLTAQVTCEHGRAVASALTSQPGTAG
jgi:hypothetical protein